MNTKLFIVYLHDPYEESRTTFCGAFDTESDAVEYAWQIGEEVSKPVNLNPQLPLPRKMRLWEIHLGRSDENGFFASKLKALSLIPKKFTQQPHTIMMGKLILGWLFIVFSQKPKS